MSPRHDILHGRRAPLMALLCVIAIATASGSIGACELRGICKTFQIFLVTNTWRDRR